MQLEDKSVLITGGASGLGLATALFCQSQGASVTVLDLNQEVLAQVQQTYGFAILQANVAQADEVETALSSMSDVHVVVNCAGIVAGKRIVGKSGPQALSDFSKVIEVNLIGTFNVMRVAAAKMLQQEPLSEDGERGVIINTASVAAFDGQIGQAAYSASKGGIVSMTLPAAREFAQFGVRVMAIAPGIMATPMMASLPEKVQCSLGQAVPFPQRMGSANEFAQLVGHIVQNSYLNGDVIRLDGAIRMTAK
jgi:NAD(P)-dependent dehydrogenase (short-subunit alcohol dehydrogenase family)